MSLSGDARTTETIAVEGMTCVGCARTLENEFRAFDGIDFKVSFDNKAVTVSFAPQQYTLQDFEAAVEKHGYRIKR